MAITRTIPAFICCAALGVLGYAAPRAQERNQPSSAVRTTVDISGFWGLSFDGRKVPSARLTPAITRAALDLRSRKDVHAIRWCNMLGTPALMDAGSPLDIRQGTTAVIIAPENQSAPRYLYLNRQQHVSKDIYDPSTNGDSIARPDGDSLVVDTIGFHESRGVTSIPGGGFKTASSHLVERYRLLSNGSVLSVTFTWTDPKVFRAPHTYEFRYYRMPKHYEALMAFPCNPYDDVRSAFIGDPAPFTPEGAR
jgi:hypothetical protein